ncbi:MAG: hypothetical protein ABI859_13290 [Pseudomonadota bacterium]
MVRPGLATLLVFVLLPCAARAAAPGAPSGVAAAVGDVLVLFDQFVSAGAAASQCASPDDRVAIRFLSNFQWISTHATREIGHRTPGISNDEVAQELARRSKAVKDETHALVKSEGCEGSTVQRLLHYFSVQSTWKRENG